MEGNTGVASHGPHVSFSKEHMGRVDESKPHHLTPDVGLGNEALPNPTQPPEGLDVATDIPSVHRVSNGGGPSSMPTPMQPRVGGVNQDMEIVEETLELLHAEKKGASIQLD